MIIRSKTLTHLLVGLFFVVMMLAIFSLGEYSDRNNHQKETNYNIYKEANDLKECVDLLNSLDLNPNKCVESYLEIKESNSNIKLL